METPNTDRIEDLLPRYCSGEATVEECRQVEEWIRQSDENYRIAKQIHTLYLATDTMQVLSKVDTEKALSSVCQKVSKNSVRPKVTGLLGCTRCSHSVYSSFNYFRLSKLEASSSRNSPDDRSKNKSGHDDYG